MDQTLLPYRGLLTKSELSYFNRLFAFGIGYLILGTFSFLFAIYALAVNVSGPLLSYAWGAIPVFCIFAVLYYSNQKNRYEHELKRQVNLRMAERLLLDHGLVSTVTPVRIGRPQSFIDLNNEERTAILYLSKNGKLEVHLVVQQGAN